MKHEVRYRVHTGPPLVPILSQMHPLQAFPKIHSDISSHVRLGFLRGLYPSGFLTKILYAFLIFPMRATCPTHPHWLDHPNYIW
jgi:hypothetical protein